MADGGWRMAMAFLVSVRSKTLSQSRPNSLENSKIVGTGIELATLKQIGQLAKAAAGFQKGETDTLAAFAAAHQQKKKIDLLSWWRPVFGCLTERHRASWHSVISEDSAF